MTATLTADGRPADGRISQLNKVSTRRLVDPETFEWGSMRSGAVIGRELLSVHDLDVDLSDDALDRLSREQVASMLDAGVRFEAALTAGFALQIAEAGDVTDPRIVYMFHEIGEETRHSRAFVRLIEELSPTARNPFERGAIGWFGHRMMRWVVRQPALLTVLILGGEEIPDLLQRIASEHPDTDPLLAAVNRYHRQEEARHLSFARAVLPELWTESPLREQRRVRWLAPRIIEVLFDTMVHPGVYEAVGLPGWATWKAVRRSPSRVALRHAATRPILATLVSSGVLTAGRVPRPWQELCGADRHGRPRPGDVPVPGLTDA
ncbi:MAG: diiron oxygenase [Actinobacteria bacterium]|nr:diiron oxygenase [Actinomycetota bacterium]